MEIFIVNGQGGSGKALPNSTIIPTPEGPKLVGNIEIGDYLFDRKGNPTKVLGIFPQGKKEVYELKFKDGRTAKCSKDHLWNIHKQSWHRISSKNKFIPYTTEQINKEGLQISERQGYRFSIQCSEPVHYKEKTYDIHPYIIGAFLGNGCCLERILTLSSNDTEIIEKINFLIGNYGYVKNSKNNYSWAFLSPPEHKNNNNVELKFLQTQDFFKNYQREICQYSYNKKIPCEYKYGSIEQRLNLIQGLMDTDGSIDKKGRVAFTSTSLQLILDVKEVLGSLGYVSTIHEDKRINKYTNKCYYLNINIDNKEKYKLFSLTRKKEIALSLPVSNFDYTTTRIIDIKDLGYQEEMTCFLVDNEEHLFLMNDFIVTHNTTFEQFVCELCENGGAATSMVAYVKQIAEKFGWTGTKSNKDRLMLSRLKDLLTEWDNSPFKTTCMAAKQMEREGYDVCFIDAREPEDIKKLKDFFNCKTILIVKEPFKIIGNHADDQVYDYNYDITIYNTGTLEDLKESAKIFYNNYILKIKGE